MGFFLAIEGGDGSGKGTQTKILTEYLQSIGKNVFAISFPQHGEFSAYYADQYLNGVYGGVNDVHADLASLTYAIDRFAASKDILKVLEDPEGIVIADRYVASNLAHQGTKFADADERQAYYERMMKTEYETLGIPVPDLNIILLVPAVISQQNVDKKDARNYTTLKRDIHEADSNHLELAKQNYEEIAGLYPEKFVSINSMNEAGDAMRSIDEIQMEIRGFLKF